MTIIKLHFSGPAIDTWSTATLLTRYFKRDDQHILSSSDREFELDLPGHFGASMAFVARYGVHVLVVEQPTTAAAVSLGDYLAERLDFLVAWVSEADYEASENETGIAVLEARGVDLSTIPTVPDEVWGDEIVDISNNPGRRVFRRGYVEGVGSTMWLHSKFARNALLAGSPRPELVSIGTDKSRLVFAEQVFVHKQDRPELQRDIRTAVFGTVAPT